MDSSGVARQLQEKLTNRGYEVFLDESSIAPGAEFQRELMSWLDDTDFMLVLASPRLGDSRWVLKEIELANLAYVGILGVCWPKARGEMPGAVSALMNDQQFPLEMADLEGRPGLDEEILSEKKLEELVAEVDRYRARAVSTRLQALVPFLKDTAHASGFVMSPAERFGDFQLVRQHPATWHVRVLPFRPKLGTIGDLQRDLLERNALDSAGCFYAENDVNDPQKAVLEWALRPERPRGEGGPRRFRLVPYVGTTPVLD